MPTPYDNTGHAEGSTYRQHNLRVTYRREGFAASPSRPWMCVRGGTVTTLTGATAVEAMRALGDADVAHWTHMP